ncbi:hypothetical protein [Natrinema sp. 74]|uniref:hypothetical protein n=1 Tax=Natrinema sp. 74 TaxID=3384159 RepID=UPI0038D444D0
MSDGDPFTIEFALSTSGVSDVQSGRPPGGGSVRITTADGKREYDLSLFTYSFEEFLEAVPEMLRGGHGGISTEDTTHLVLEREDDSRGHVTICFSRDAIEDPERRLLPRDDRPLDAVVPLSVIVDEVVTAAEDLIDHIEQLNESAVEREWFRDLNADLEEARSVAEEHLQ